ncbi:hypothetical protein [Halomonas sp. WWR20]
MTLTSALILLMLLTSIVASLLDAPLWPAAVLGWWATCRLWPGLPRTSRRQSAWLGGIGLLIWSLALLRGTPNSLIHAFAINQPLLMMFAGVSFLAMARPADTVTAHHTQGSLWGTLLGVHLFGAVINLSVLFLFGDRMQRSGVLNKQQAIVLGRAFPAAAAWSPFFVAMGAALTYVPGLDYLELLPWGLMSAALLLGLVAFEARRGEAPFIGYPLQPQALLLPGVLALAVIGVHHFWPALSILLIISVAAPFFAILMLPRTQRNARLRFQLQEGLPRLAPQFALFLAAGLLSSGLAALLASWPGNPPLPIDHFTHLHAWITLGMIVALAFVGIHPLVSIVTLAPLLAPLGPDPTLLGMLYLMGWALGTGSSPLSGSNLALSVRYGIAARDLLRWNFPYAVLGWLACGSVFALHAWAGPHSPGAF